MNLLKIKNGGLHIVHAFGVQIVKLRLKPKYENHIKSGDVLASKVSVDSFISKSGFTVKC